jgi:hypothetical protein
LSLFGGPSGCCGGQEKQAELSSALTGTVFNGSPNTSRNKKIWVSRFAMTPGLPRFSGQNVGKASSKPSTAFHLRYIKTASD